MAAAATEPDQTTSPVDLRLAVGALAAWLTAAGALGVSAAVGYLAGAVAVLGALSALVLAGTHGAPTRVGHLRWPVIALVLGCAGASALATAVRVQARDASPLAALAEARAAVTLEFVVRDDPRPVARSAGGPERVALRATATRATTAGPSGGTSAAGPGGWHLSADVLVLAPADGWRELLPSQRVRAEGRLSPPRRADLTTAVASVRGAPRLVGEPSAAQRAAGRLRSGLRQAAAVLPDGPRGVLPGLVVGDTSALDPALVQDFKTTGLTHLVAVSGTNCSIVAGAVLLVLRAATVGPRTSAVCAGLALAAFVVLARPSPSVLRAAVMGGIALVALATGRARSAVPSLAATVLLLVLAAPSLAREPGFALSVLATAALMLVAPAWAERLRRRGVPRGVAEAVAVPAGAHLVTAPMVAALSGTVSLVAVPANLLAAPAVAPATVLGVLAALVSPIWPAAAELLVRGAGLPTGWLVAIAERGARLPAATLPWPRGTAGAALLVVAVVAGALVARSRAVRRGALAAAVGAMVVALPVHVVLPTWPPPGWLVVACDVGQGDALVVRAGAGAGVVVDAGPSPIPVDRCLRRLGVSRVPLLVLTHLHADHVGGLDGVLRGRAVGPVEVGPLREPAWAWREVVAEAQRRGLPVWSAAVGEARDVAGVRMEVLAPRASFHGTRSDPNNSSVVLRLRAQGRTILLTGDVEIEAQEAMLREGVDVRADVLKVPHHGSAWQSPQFLSAVHPSIAVISVGAGNDYGHPSAQVIAALRGLGARTVRTDQDGDIAICDSGGRLAVVLRVGRPP